MKPSYGWGQDAATDGGAAFTTGRLPLGRELGTEIDELARDEGGRHVSLWVKSGPCPAARYQIPGSPVMGCGTKGP